MAIAFTLTPTDENRLDKLLVGALSGHDISRVRLQSLIKGGYLSLGGEVVMDPSYKVRGEVFGELVVPAPVETEILPVAMDLSIIYEDDDILVVDKPWGLATHPGAGNYDNTLVNGLLHYYSGSGCLSLIGGVMRPGIVHRLDKDTSGLLVVAKNDGSHHHLSGQFSSHTVSRIYHAVCLGVPKPYVGVVDKLIGRHVRDRKRMQADRVGGKVAVTHYCVSEIFGGKFSLVECRLETGRTHQIRVHMSSIGHGLVGDRVYGRGAGVLGFGRQALHAGFLGFEHPRSGERLEFESEYPVDFVELLKKCRDL